MWRNPSEKGGTGSGAPNSRSATPVPSQEVSEDNSVNDNATLKRCGNLISDIKVLERRILELWDAEISIILPEMPTAEEDQTPFSALKACLGRLTDLIPLLASHIVAILTRRSCEPLSLVPRIPQQYRAMSNKKNPSEPSHFVRDILRPISSFFSTMPQSVREDLGPVWASEIFGAVCQRYVSHLHSMKRTEESLRRLQRGQLSAFSLFSSRSPTANNQDDDKRVRMQMILDVTALGQDARLLGVDIDKHAAYLDLKTLTESES